MKSMFRRLISRPAMTNVGHWFLRFHFAKTLLCMRTLRFMRVSIRHWDLWPMVGLMAGFVAGTIFISVYNLTKYDVWLDRTKSVPPWDWSRFRDKYRTQTTRLVGRKELYKCYEETAGPIEQLEDELLELSQKYLKEHKP
ncbi:B12D domain containing protein [Trichuris trichiura]|uniref:B12D domain containing protein n=1 Tax=Trichuris trichiura TaxID=36087 RepID=A0A077Z9Y8_TRITR|nr:B12D domain containing protein [Trichuris trichiura]